MGYIWSKVEICLREYTHVTSETDALECCISNDPQDGMQTKQIIWWHKLSETKVMAWADHISLLVLTTTRPTPLTLNTTVLLKGTTITMPMSLRLTLSTNSIINLKGTTERTLKVFYGLYLVRRLIHLVKRSTTSVLDAHDSQSRLRRFHLEFSNSSSNDSDMDDISVGWLQCGRYSSYMENTSDEDDCLRDAPDTVEVTEDDPLYAHLKDPLNSGAAQASDPLADACAPGDLPQVFYKDSLVRQVYVQAFIAAAFHNAMHSLVNYMLEGQHQLLTSISQCNGSNIPGLDKMARTLLTVEHCLGVDPDQHINYYLLAASVGRADNCLSFLNSLRYSVLSRSARAGLKRRSSGPWEVEDIDIDELGQWFCGMKRGKYFVEAIYCTICNNPRSKRFLCKETNLLAVIPGPDELSLKQLNSVLEIFVQEARQLYSGDGYTHLFFSEADASDLPGARKATGLRGHTVNRFMCPVCKKSFNSLAHHNCYDPSSVYPFYDYKYREDWWYLKYVYCARFEDPATHEEISDCCSIRWSILNILPDWLPAHDSPLEFMHAGYLGKAKHVIQGILIAGGMFTKCKNSGRPLERFKTFLETLWLIRTFNRVPANLLTGVSGKVDQWCLITVYLPVPLDVSWQINGDIPDKNAPRPKGNIDTLSDLEKEATDRNYLQHYKTILEWRVTMRIWGSRSIIVEEAHRAHDCHMYACQAWTHMIVWILRLGPVYACHLGELEVTMMRSWMKLHLMHNLLIRFKNLGNAKTPEDKECIEDLKTRFWGLKTGSENKGTLLGLLASMAAEDSRQLVVYPKHSCKINLKHSGIYNITLRFLQAKWQAHINLVSDIVLATLGTDSSHLFSVAKTTGTHTCTGVRTVRSRRYGDTEIPELAELWTGVISRVRECTCKIFGEEDGGRTETGLRPLE
ncbi:hypothetical protein FKP32DRAFT_1605216 [Trametes sanguinea]|nr:hypothetical protein FKP32DRAFT_1605216 [Trametes sanguinea]